MEYPGSWASIYNFVSFIRKTIKRSEIVRVDEVSFALVATPIEKGDKTTMKIHLQAKATGHRDSLCFLERGEGCHFTRYRTWPPRILFSLPFDS